MSSDPVPPPQPDNLSNPAPPPQAHNPHKRKEKSLGIICSNFMALYSQMAVDTININDVAIQLGVPMRRVYDILIIMETVGIITKGKYEYHWKGITAIPSALLKLKEEGLTNNTNAFQDSADVEVCSKKNQEKMLSQLTRNFIKHFICSDASIISQVDFKKLLFDDIGKSRRLYDIANALCSLNLIEKTTSREDKAPAYRWLGYNPDSKFEFASSLVENVNEPKKRTFGVDIRNICVKRNKTGDSCGKDSSQQVQRQTNLQTLGSDIVTSLDHDSTESLKKYTFGPFDSVRIPKVSNMISNKSTPNYDWDNLASIHQPQYYNRASKDLFDHYMEAWKFWCAEVVEQKKHNHQNI